MRNDYRLLLTAMLDEAKSEKIIKQQLINIQNKSQISLNIKINEKADKKLLTNGKIKCIVVL